MPQFKVVLDEPELGDRDAVHIKGADDGAAQARLPDARTALLVAAALLVSLIASLVVIADASALTRRYQVSSLGTLGGSSSAAADINDDGEVVGSSMIGNDAATHAFLYDDGQLDDLGTLPGGTNSGAAAINASGQVTGTSETLIPPWEGCVRCPAIGSIAFRYEDGKMADLGHFPWRYPYAAPASYGNAINDLGTVAGMALSNSLDAVAVMFRDGGLFALPVAALEPFAYGINNRGQIVGGTHGPRNGSPFLYDGQAVSIYPIEYGGATAINNAGHFVGDGKLVTDSQLLPHRAFVNVNGSFQWFGGEATFALAINDADVVVGESTFPPGAQREAFVYANGVMRRLSELIPRTAGWVLQTATGVNQRGQIVGTGLYRGQTRAFLLTPIRS
jgi:probable HAF family extracellular repeat protein